MDIRKEAMDEALRRYDSDWIINEDTGNLVQMDDWGYADTERSGFIAGAIWAQKLITSKMLAIVNEEEKK